MTQDLDLILNPSSHIEVLRDFPPKSFAFGAKLPALFAKFHSFRQKQENINCCQGERTIQQRTSKLPWVKVQYFDEGVKRYSIFKKYITARIRENPKQILLNPKLWQKGKLKVTCSLDSKNTVRDGGINAL